MAKYRALAQQLTHEILTGDYPIGSLLPTEHELCKQWQISRHTAREALRCVERLGLVVRRQGSGTQVVRTTLPERINQFVSSVQDLMQFGQETRFALEHCDMVEADDTLAELLMIGVNEPCIHLAGVRVKPDDKKPICYTHIYRSEHGDGTERALKDKETAIQALISFLEVSRIGKIEQQFSACLMNLHYAQALQVEKDSPAIKITRRYFDKNQQLILVAESVHPADRFTYSNVLLPNQ